MEEDGSITWDKLVTMIFVVSAIIVLLVLVFLMFVLPMLKE
jgi:hypothetical protein